MGEQSRPSEELQVMKPAKDPISKIIFLIVFALFLTGLAAGTAYWWRDKTASDFEEKQADKITSLQDTVAKLEEQLTELKDQPSNSGGDLVCQVKSPTDAAAGNIEASITSGNTAALETYMAASVNVVFAASGGFGSKTSAQAVASISDFISDNATSWDYNFELPAPTLADYASGDYAKYFPEKAIVGVATNKKVISFSFDCNGKINTVFMSSSEDLLK